MAPGDTSSAERKSLTENTSSADSVTVSSRRRASTRPSTIPTPVPTAPSSAASPSTMVSTCRRAAPTQRSNPICCRRAATLVETALATTKTAARSASPEMPESSVRYERRMRSICSPRRAGLSTSTPGGSTARTAGSIRSTSIPGASAMST